MKVAVLVFPGSNCDQDMLGAWQLMPEVVLLLSDTSMILASIITWRSTCSRAASR